MIVSIRSALLIAAALSASSVAPAQVAPAGNEPLIPANSTTVASVVVPTPLPSAAELATPGETPDTDEQTVEPDPSADLPTLVAELRSSDPGSDELECLAAGIYFESKGEPLKGQLAVGQVIENRVESSRFPDTYCGVILQRGQFSFVRHHSWPHIRKNSRAWKTAVAVAQIVDRDLKESAVGDSLFFHARHVRPGWHKARVASIGNHIFFR